MQIWPTLKKIPRKVVVLVVILVIVAVFAIKTYVETPRDLGPRLKYLETKQTGCPIPIGLGGGLLLCSQEMGHVYYFETDMTAEEIQQYFPNTFDLRRETSSPPSVPDGFSNQELGFQFNFNGEVRGFYLELYDDPKYVSEKLGLKQTKKHILRITDEGYKFARILLRI